MSLFLIGLLFGILTTLSIRKALQWLSIRALPARYLQTHTVRRRKLDISKKAERSE